MSVLRGERFPVDLQEDDVHLDQKPEVTVPPLPVSDLVGDIQERDVSTAANPPEPPPLRNEATGFPSHKDRTGRSKVKQLRGRTQNASGVGTDESQSLSPESGGLDPSTGSVERDPGSFDKLQRRQIDEENRRRLAEMSTEDIERERQQLISTLDPSLIEKLLNKPVVGDDQASPEGSVALPDRTKERPKRPSSHTRKVSFAVPDAGEATGPHRPTAKRHSISFSGSASTASSDAESDYSRSPSRSSKRPSPTHRKVSFALPDSEGMGGEEKQTSERHSFSSETSTLTGDPDDPPVPRKYSLNPLDPNPQPSLHFPRPSSTELDPGSDNFFDDLHKKYFPDMAHDPSKLEWMKPADPSEDAVYDPSAAAIDPSDVRFSFAGRIIPPSIAHSLPTNLGLHNHGDAPSAAGYTIPELARLARSAYPAQRCMAMQTLGRILYRIGVGEFGDENNAGATGADGERARLAKGLWDSVDEGGCVDTLTTEADKTEGHQTSIAIAQEAVWLWRRGGGRKRKAA